MHFVSLSSITVTTCEKKQRDGVISLQIFFGTLCGRCIIYKLRSITTAARFRARSVFVESNTGVVDSNPTCGMDICVFILCLWVICR
jgi:hypothetical protein